jgi:hypothetical protein
MFPSLIDESEHKQTLNRTKKKEKKRKKKGDPIRPLPSS